MRILLSHTAATLGGLLLFFSAPMAQKPSYPKEIRGYKIERAAVEMKKDKEKNGPFNPDPDTLIRFGEARLAGVTPLGISLEIPVVVAPVTQKGHVDFLRFEDVVVNGTPVIIDDYKREFDLPNKEDLVLDEPLRFWVNLPNAMLAGIGELTSPNETWTVTGRVYVCGHFKKFLFTFKRSIPVELNLTMQNPLRNR
jgi:hypothetical protein